MTPDSELVRRVLAGDPTAFDALVARHRSTVYRQALRRVCLPQDAEEVAQNVFLKTYVYLYQFRQEADFSAWLRTITARESISWLRSRKPSADDPDSLYEAAPDTAPSPESALMDIELRQRVRNALASLPESERQVAQAFYLEGRSYNEIQDRYGLARSSVAGYLYRARQKLAHRLEGLLSLSWIPGWEVWSPTLNLIGNGGTSAPVTKTAVTVATVATVAVMSGVTPPMHRPENPVKVKELSSRPAVAASDAGLLNRMLRPFSKPLELGPRLALAAEPSKADSLMTRAEKDRVTFKQGNRIWSFVMEGGRLFVEEGGEPRRSATAAEQAQYRVIQADMLARTRSEAEALARADAQLKEFEGRDGPELSEEEARKLEEAEERIHEQAEALSRKMEGRSAEVERLAEEIERRAERRADAISKRVEKRAEEFARRAERHGREIEKRTEEIERWAERFAEEAERQHRGDKSAKPNWKEFNSRMERFHREMSRDLERMRPVQEEAQRFAREATAEIGPMMEELQPLIDEMTRLQADRFKDFDQKIQKEIRPLVERAQRDVQNAMRTRQESLRKQQEDREKARAAREKAQAERDKAHAEREREEREEAEKAQRERNEPGDSEASNGDEIDSDAEQDD